MPVPEWVDRLRDASFVSPSGIESFFKLDILTRIGGKKASIHEILNKNEAIPQDQGNRSRTYPIEAYFTDGNGDLESDIFFDSLHEKYTIDSPGILKHPRWGDIAVMPFDVQQSENIINEGGIFRVPVSFREIPQSIFPIVGTIDQSEIISDITEMESILEDANSAINIDDPTNFAEFGAKINDIVNIVDNSIGEIAARVDDIEDTFRKIQDDIDKAISVGASAIEIMSQVNNLIRLPGQIIDSTISKIEAFATMGEGIITSFAGFFNPDAERKNQLNQAIMFQSLTMFTSAAIAESALFTDFQTRDAASKGLDFVNDSALASEQGTSEIYQTLAGSIQTLFSPDHNTGSSLADIIAKTNAILIDRSFDLKTRQTEILKSDSDAITLTWKKYKDMDMLEFFILTNNLTDNEFIEIPAGREIVYYL